jgi:rubrerythrin
VNFNYDLKYEFTDNSIDARNERQNCRELHPYTCGNNRTDEAHTKYQEEHDGDFGQLVAVEDGWLCPVCGYTQKLTR